MSPRVAGLGSEARLALAPCVGSGRQSRNEGTWALHSRVQISTPGTPGWSRAGTVPWARPHPALPQARSQSPQLLLLVQLLEKALAKFIGADHDGAGRGHLDDAGQEPCKDSVL